MRPVVWHPNRAKFREIAPVDPLSKREHQIIRLIRNAPDKRRTRRQLQQTLSRRVPTRLLDHMLNRLRAEDRITTTPDGSIYPFGRAEGESCFASFRTSVLR